MSTASLILTNVAPIVTAGGAIMFGVLNHKSGSKKTEQDRFQKTIEELHGLYHNLVADLGAQVERLNETNKALIASNESLVSTVEELSGEREALRKTVDRLTTQVKSLRKSEKSRADHEPEAKHE